MDLKLYTCDTKIKYNKLKNALKKNQNYLKDNEDVRIFHYNDLNKDVFHVVFYINEKYITKSKFVNEISSRPVNVYINSFIFINKDLILIENIYKEYCNLICDNIEKKLGLKFKEKYLSNKYFSNIINKSKRVFLCEFDIDDCIEPEEDIDKIHSRIEQNDKVDFLNFTMDIDEYKNVLISLWRNGKFNLKTTTSEILVKVLEKLLEEFNE